MAEFQKKIPSPGGALTRTLSSSHITPRTLTGYQDFFRLSSRQEDGWLDVKIGSTGTWTRQWIVFDNGALSYAPTREQWPEHQTRILMDNVISFRIADLSGMSILVTTTDFKLHLRASSKDEINRWIFIFQRSVALVLSHLIESSQSPATSRGGIGTMSSFIRQPSIRSFEEPSPAPSRPGVSGGGIGGAISQAQAQTSDAKIWLSELGHGHGWHSAMVKKRQSFHGGADGTLGVETMESPTDIVHREESRCQSREQVSVQGLPIPPGSDASVWDRSHNQRSTVDFSQLYAGEAGQGHRGAARSDVSHLSRSMSNLPSGFMSNSVGVASSPAIPILYSQQNKDAEDQKLASSYVEENQKVLAHRLSDVGRGVGDDEDDDVFREVESMDEMDEDPDCDESSGSGVQGAGGSDEDDMLFELDDGRPKPASPSNSRQAQQQRRPSLNGKAGSSDGRSRSSSGAATPRALRWVSGFCTRLGPRNKNEDRFASFPNLAKEVVTLTDSARLAGVPVSRQAYFGVYDGHCGDQASTYLQAGLHTAICEHPLFHVDLNTAITETCIQFDREFLARCKESNLYCGTTALGAFIRDKRLVVFNIGDCHAVLCSHGLAVNMSDAHKPGRADEEARILQARGWVTEERELYMGRLHRMDLSDQLVRDKAQQVNWVTIHRVCGELAVSRSIGDPDYKGFTPGAKVDAFFMWPDDHDQVFEADLVIPNPEIMSRDLEPGDEFLLMASDGLWDVVSPEDAVSFVRVALADNKATSEAAEELCDLALKLGSSDNVTLVIVQFIHSS